jgi:hypothetical protein
MARELLDARPTMRTSSSLTPVAAFVASASVFLTHCAPPPFALAMEGTHRDAVGSISAGGYASYAGDLTSATFSSTDTSAPRRVGVSPSGLFGGRVSRQFARNVAAGAELAGGVQGTGNSALGVVGGRVHVRVHPDSDHLAFVAGLGGGSTIAPGLTPAGSSSPHYDASGFGSLDLGARVGTRIADRVDVYASQTIAIALVWFQMQMRQPWMFYSVTEIGAIVKATPQLGIGAHLSMAFQANDNGALDRPCFIPSLSARYTFDVR